MASIFSDSWINQVFEGRNQNYGAYELRRRSARSASIAMLIALTVFVLGLTAPMIVNALTPKKKEEKKEKKEVKVEMTKIEEEIFTPEVEIIIPPPLKDQIKFTPPKIVEDEEVTPEDIPPAQDDFNDTTEAGAETAEGDPEGVDLTALDIKGEDVIGDEESDKVFIQVEQMPEFPGGDAAMLKYLNSIPYPPQAKENDIEGSVFVKFVVDKSGKVTEVEVKKGSDKILNDAALAHVKKMPPWKPGKQNGKEVKVQYIVPIKFVLQ